MQLEFGTPLERLQAMARFSLASVPLGPGPAWVRGQESRALASGDFNLAPDFTPRILRIGNFAFLEDLLVGLQGNL